MEKHLNISNQFIPYELAVKLKELGFNEDCLCFYLYHEYNVHSKELQKVFSVGLTNIAVEPTSSGKYYAIKAPLWQQAFDWFTSKGYHSYIEGAYPWFRYYINTDDDRYEGFKHLKLEEARQACLEKLIELVK